MTEITADSDDGEIIAKMTRSLDQEFGRFESDYDYVRPLRMKLVDKLVFAAQHVKILKGETGIEGEVSDDTETGLKVVGAALKALVDVEKSASSAVMIKLKRQEQDVASAQLAKDRIAIMIAATAPGRIEGEFPTEKLEQQLTELFDGKIQDFETKASNRDLS